MRAIQQERRKVLGLEIVDFPEVMRRFFKKLLRSNALDALDAAVVNEPITVEAAQAFRDTNQRHGEFCRARLGTRKGCSAQRPRCGSLGAWEISTRLCIP